MTRPLLARSLKAIAGTLEVLAEQARTASAEASSYAQAVEADAQAAFQQS